MNRLRRLLVCILLILALATPFVTPSVAAAAVIRVYLDGVQLSFADQTPVIENNRTLVPARFVSEAFGATVGWDEATGSVPIKLGDTHILLRIGQRTVLVNDQLVLLDVPAAIRNGRTMVPLRFVSEVLGAEVSWSDAHSSVFVRRNAAVSAFRNSYSPANFVNVSVSGNSLEVSGADSGADAWVWVMVRDTRGERVAEAIVPLSADRTYVASITPRLPVGQYNVEVYIGPERIGTYISRHLGIALVQGERALLLPQPLMYEHNYAQFTVISRDLAALSTLKLANQAQEAELRALAAEITQGTDNDYVKLLAIHDWVARNIYYDFDSISNLSYNANTAYPVFVSRRAVCQGYSELTAALLRASGIPARVAVGHALGATSVGKTWSEVDHATSNHAWNEAYIGGRWVMLDVTWNSGNKFIGGEFLPGVIRHTYFDITLEALSLTHKIIK